MPSCAIRLAMRPKTGQSASMLWAYIGLVLRFALRRTTPIIDALQTIAASAVPALAKLAGVKMAANATDSVLAYIGLAAVAFVILRLVSAPYFIWKEQTIGIESLKSEISAPGRLEAMRMAKLRAKSRAKMARITHQMYWISMAPSATAMVDLRECNRKMVETSGPANVSISFIRGFARLVNYVVDVVSRRKVDHEIYDKLLRDMVDYLHGHITAEALALRLPPDTVSETPQ